MKPPCPPGEGSKKVCNERIGNSKWKIGAPASGIEVNKGN